MSLKEYQGKRNFKRTSEPAPRRIAAGSREKQPIFVIQKHAASHLHYDFRLEMEGVLKSWAVPKGFPMQHGDRRLAVQVEDHPFDYADFEGIIAPGNYGAGTVMVWDRGTYRVLGGEPLDALKRGKIHFALAGKKLKGEWTLVRTRRGEDEGKAQWLLLKSGEDHHPISARAEDRSAATSRSLKQIASAADRQWQSNRSSALKRSTAVPHAKSPNAPGSLPRAKPEFVEPMKCELDDKLPRGAEWIYEIKFDGIRAIAVKLRRKVDLISRNEKDFTRKYPQVAAAVSRLPCRQAVLDGEIVAVDPQGRSSFQLLQAGKMSGQEPAPILYYVFDLLNLDGRDLKDLPLVRRKEMLKELVSSIGDTVMFSAGFLAESERVIKAAKARGLEGLIAKQRDSKYEPGRRSHAWVKFKWTNEQEFVVGGYTRPKGSRSHFGALLVGYYKGKQLIFASKVGTGFDEARLASLHKRFNSLERTECPFADLPTSRGAGGLGVTAAEMRRCTWLKPELVAQIRFAEWTRDGHLRQPVFLGLREDKNPREVVRERPR